MIILVPRWWFFPAPRYLHYLACHFTLPSTTTRMHSLPGPPAARLHTTSRPLAPASGLRIETVITTTCSFCSPYLQHTSSGPTRYVFRFFTGSPTTFTLHYDGLGSATTRAAFRTRGPGRLVGHDGRTFYDGWDAYSRMAPDPRCWTVATGPGDNPARRFLDRLTATQTTVTD